MSETGTSSLKIECSVAYLRPSEGIPGYYDLVSVEDVRIRPGHRRAIRTGLTFSVPRTHRAMVFPNNEYTIAGLIVNTTAVRSDYEVIVTGHNVSGNTVRVRKGSTFAHISFEKANNVMFCEADSTEEVV